MTTREIVEAAAQRNASAVTYHFGSREGLLRELLARRGGPVDLERGRRRDALDATASTRDLVDCLIGPWCELLERPEGRAYVRIVAQLRGRFASWRVESDVATTAHLARILDELERRPDAPAEVRRERVVGLIMLMTAAAAERARLLDEEVAPQLGDAAFAENLLDMCTAVVVA